MGNPVVHFEIIAKDGPKLQSFYADLFDWKIETFPLSFISSGTATMASHRTRK
jgi:predicted enzyme related to lactoylglutathione lyase